jgi:hypothetical protein
MYALSIFMHHVLGFEVIGATNFPLESGSYRIAQGLLGAQTASINQGSSREYEVLLPTGSHTVSDDDIDRILALRSPLNPRSNSGLFRVTSASVSQNTLRVDYRSSELPPVEDNIPWGLYECENVLSGGWHSVSYCLSGYNSRLSASASRIILRNLTALNDWSVRLCLESTTDISASVPVGMSIAPGWLGDFDASNNHDLGDFTADDFHLHGPLWFDTTESVYRGSAVGIGILDAGEWTQGDWTISIVGDNISGTCLMITASGTLPGNDGMAIFGFPDDEAQGIESREDEQNIKARRLFVYGSAFEENEMSWQQGFQEDSMPQAMAWGMCGSPIPAVFSSYSDIRNGTRPREATNRADGVFTSTTELLDVEIIAGTLDVCQAWDDNRVFYFEPRRLGLVPLAKQGRSNYPVWSVTGDDLNSWLHTRNGIYIDWGGPALLNGFSGSNYTELTASSLIAGTGMKMDDLNPPASDPTAAVTVTVTKDFDAQRFRKTYSRNRQEPRLISIARQGSNPNKP